MDNLANFLSNILTAERVGKSICNARPSSNMIKKVVDIMHKQGYIGGYEIVANGRGDIVKLQLAGKINKCGVIKPRFSVKRNGYEKFEKRYLPAKGFGIIIVSTPKGVMTHVEANEKGFGGKLICYCY